MAYATDHTEQAATIAFNALRKLVLNLRRVQHLRVGAACQTLIPRVQKARENKIAEKYEKLFPKKCAKRSSEGKIEQ